jgi:adenosylcobinamide-phosphate synthase
VRGFGRLIAWCEPPLRRISRGEPRRELASGGLLTLGLVVAAYGLAATALAGAYAAHRRLGVCVEIALAWTTLATRDLLVEADAVNDALERADLAAARARLARIVGRDTQSLAPPDIARAAIETLAESASDGIVAPLCALAAGGVPLAFAFKAASTLDSMLGHVEAPYTYFGRAAAKLDDATAYMPARATVALFSLFAPCVGGNPRTAWQTAHSDGARHCSPNAGRVEAAMAGALNVRLGGRNSYAGIVHDGPLFGAAFRAPGPGDARRARALVLAAACGCALSLALATASHAP